MTGTYGIKGLPRPQDAVTKTDKIPFVLGLPVRYEITEFSTNKTLRKQWTLFVLALERFKTKPVDEKLSYFQVAGIHGYPEVPWDGAPPPRKGPSGPDPGDQPFGGYCNHNGLNFPTWHRPYMALFEQCVWDNMKEIIDHWQNKHGLPEEEAQVWLAEADKWRMPYWDWARKQKYTEDFAYPQVLVQGPIRIFVPDAVKEYYPPSGLYANPFWGFENPEKDEHGDPLPFGNMPEKKKAYNIDDDPVIGEHPKELPKPTDPNPWVPWSQCSGTSRYGLFISNDGQEFRGLEGVNNPWEANYSLSTMKEKARWGGMKKFGKIIKFNPGTLADAVNRMFCEGYHKTWGTFASTKWFKEGNVPDTGYLSLEYIHNNVHNITGGSSYVTGVGHMSDVPVAAFDPIFWLHHCQVDRLLAIWQSLHWDLWFDQEEPGKGNVEDDTELSSLFPFHTVDGGDPDKDVWNAKGVKDWTVFNYHYDDLMDLAFKKKTFLPDGSLDEARYKQELYLYINDTYPNAGHLIESIRTNPDLDIPDGLYLEDKPNVWHDYIINVTYDRYALDGRSYTIEFYLGGPEDKPETSFASQNLVGQIYTFGGGIRKTADSCANCKTQSDEGILSRGQVPLTIQLLHHTFDRIEEHPLADFTAATQYLTDHLRWKFIAFGGAEVPHDLFPNTNIKVLRGIGKPRLVKRLQPSQPVKPAAADGIEVYSLMANADEVPKVALPPVYGGYEVLPEVTLNKPGGYNYQG